MTQRGYPNSSSTPSFSEETPMDDILMSIRHMVVEEETALVNLKKVSDQVHQMVGSLTPSSASMSPQDSEETFHPHPEEDLSTLCEPLPLANSDHTPEIQFSSSEKRSEPLTSSPVHSKISPPPEEYFDSDETGDYPLPILEGLADIAEDFLTDDQDTDHWHRYHHRKDEQEQNILASEAPSFLQRHHTLDDISQEQLLPVVNLTTIVHSDGSITPREGFEDLQTELTQNLVQSLSSSNENAIVTQAFEILFARIAEPLIKEWLSQNASVLLERYLYRSNA